jgi:hypothetical protein
MAKVKSKSKPVPVYAIKTATGSTRMEYGPPNRGPPDCINVAQDHICKHYKNNTIIQALRYPTELFSHVLSPNQPITWV